MNDTINTAAAAASSALLENDPEGAKKQMINSLKRSGKKTKDVVGKIAKNKLDQVLTGRGKRGGYKGKRGKLRTKKISLLDD